MEWKSIKFRYFSHRSCCTLGERGGQDVIENFVASDPDINVQKSDSYDETLSVRILYIIKTLYAPRVHTILEKRRKLKSTKKRKLPAPNPCSKSIRAGSEESFEAVWGVSPKVAFGYIQKAYKGGVIEIFEQK